jgi:hypothetical protein
LLRHQQVLLGDKPIASKNLTVEHSTNGACCTNFNRHRDHSKEKLSPIEIKLLWADRAKRIGVDDAFDADQRSTFRVEARFFCRYAVGACIP